MSNLRSVANLITTAQAAEKVGVSVRTVIRWVEAGDLAAAQKLPGATGAYLFDEDAVDDFIAKNTETTVRRVRAS